MTDTDRIERAIAFLDDAVSELDPTDAATDSARRKMIAAADELGEVVRIEQINENADFADTLEGA